MSNAKTRDIRTRLSIEGEEEYKAALTTNAAKARELASEMELLDTRFEDNADSQEYLTQRAQLLARQQENAAEKARIYSEYTESARQKQERLAQALEEGRQKLARQQEKLESLTQQYGENSEQVQKAGKAYKAAQGDLDALEKQQRKAADAVTRLQTSTNKAQTAQEKLKNAVQKTTPPVKEYGKEAEGAAQQNQLLDAVVGDLSGQLGVNLPQSATVALGSMGSLATGAGAAATVAAAAVGALVQAGKALIQLTLEQGEAAVEVAKASAQTGIAAERLQQLEFAAAASGVEMGVLTDTAKDLTQAIANAEDKTSEEYQAFRQLGIDVRGTNGELKSSGEIWEELVQRLGRVQNQTERARLANLLIGESYYELTPILDDVTGFYDKVNQAQEIGIGQSGEEIEKLKAVNAKYQELQSRLEAVKQSMATEAADELASAMDKVGDVVTELGDYLLDSGAVDTLAKYVDLLATWITLLETLTSIPGVDTFFKVAGAGIETLTRGYEELNGLLERFIGLWDRVASLPQNLLSSLQKSIPGHAAGTPYSPGGVVRVGEYGPETVYLPKGSRVVNAADTAAMAGGNAVYVTVNLNAPDLQKVQTLLEFFENYQLTRRKG